MQSIVTALTTVLAIAYTLTAHIAVVRQSLPLTIAAIALLAATSLLPGLLLGSIVAWLLVPVVGALCWALTGVATPVLLLYLPPMLGFAFMAWLFGHTLRPGSTPLIARMIRILTLGAEPPEPAVWGYARRLTWAWTALFLALMTVDFILALLVKPDGLLELAGLPLPFGVSRALWSSFANLIAYVIVAVFFVVEYAYRRRRFPQQPYRNMFDFIRRTVAASPQLFVTREPGGRDDDRHS